MDSSKANLVLENFSKKLEFGQTPQPPSPPQDWDKLPTLSNCLLLEASLITYGLLMAGLRLDLLSAAAATHQLILKLILILKGLLVACLRLMVMVMVMPMVMAGLRLDA